MSTKKVEAVEAVPYIFSGEKSHDLWQEIGKISKKKRKKKIAWQAHLAIYTLGCRCQELESLVRNLESRLAKYEKAPSAKKNQV